MPRRYACAAPRLIVILALAFPPILTARQVKEEENQSGPLAQIHGKITVSKKDDSRQSSMHDQMFGMYSTHGGGQAPLLMSSAALAPGRLSERAVVYLESDDLNQGTYPLPARTPSLDQKNLQFHPQVLAVMVGTRVEFPNRDNLFHNVFSYSQAKEFDLGRYPKDDSRSVTFDRAGVVRVYCDIHSHMSATILVLKHPYFSSPDDAGEYALPHIPPGKYRVILWVDREILERKSVEVRAGENLQLDFTN
jgi:plastocyanin